MVDVAIIITYYKQEKFLYTLLEYLSDNKWMLVKEVIVIDDASLSHYDILLYKKKYPEIQIISNETNSGPSFSRNRGVKLATAKYIQFLDADDWIEKNKIQIQYEKAIEYSEPSFICSQWARVTLDSEYDNYNIIDTYTPNMEEPGLFNIMVNFFPLMSGLILRKDFIKIGGFNEEMRLIEDVNLAIRLFNLRENFLLLRSKPLFFYRVNNPNSLSNSNTIEFNSAILKNYKLCFNLAKIKYDEETINKYKTDTFGVLWYVYLFASKLEDKKLLKDCIQELKKIRRPIHLTLKHGKTFLLAKLLGLSFTAKILALK